MAKNSMKMDDITLSDVILEEKKQLLERRKKLKIEHGTSEDDNWFGIALSGGGIRSATINLGFLKTLHRFGVIKKADYMSSVSGGGYTHSYVQGTTKEKGSLDGLFSWAKPVSGVVDPPCIRRMAIPRNGILLPLKDMPYSGENDPSQRKLVLPRPCC